MIELIKKLLALLGMKSWSQKQLAKYEKTLKSQEQNNRNLQDKLEDYKMQIAEKEHLIQLKEKEMQSAHGELLEIVKEEIATLFEDLEVCRGRRDIIFRNIKTGKLLVAKLEELIQGLETPEKGVDVDDIILTLDALHDELRDNDKLADELKHKNYKRRETVQEDVMEKLRRFNEERVPAEQRKEEPVAKPAEVKELEIKSVVQEKELEE